ncbi:MAG: PAS domain-containing protein [Gemmobacter sp.]
MAGLGAPESLLAAALGGLADPVSLLDPAGIVVWVNDAAARRSGYGPGDLCGRPYAAATRCAATGIAALRALDAACTAGTGATVEITLATRAGLPYVVEARLQPLRDGDGGLCGFSVQEIDLTERNRLVAEAQDARRKLENAVSALPDGFAYYDGDDRLVLCNERYREFYPRSAAAMRTGATFEAILRHGLAHGEYRDAVGREDAWLAHRLAEHRLPMNEQEQHLADGRWIRVLEKATPEGGRVGIRMDVTALKNAERRLEDIIVGAAAGTWEWSICNGEHTINARWAGMLGYTLAELAPVTIETWERLVHPDDLRVAHERLARVLCDGEAQLEHESRMRHRDGHWVNVLSRGRVTRRTADGRPAAMAGVHIDVSAIKRAEARLEDIIRGAALGTWEIDFKRGLNIVNERWAQMIGYRLDELGPPTIDNWLSRLHPADRAMLDAQHEGKVRDGQDLFENTFRLRHRKGHWVWVLSRGRVMQRDADGQPVVIAGIHIDISDLKQREAALEAANAELELALAERDAAERRFFDIAAVSSDWFWEQDADLRFTFISDSFRRATGDDPARVIGRTRAELFAHLPEVQASADWAWLDARLRARLPFDEFVYLVPADSQRDRTRWVRISGAPFEDAEGRFAGYRGVASDVTQLYTAKERAEAANRAKSRFLANMSHEIRTPLNGVLGMAELLEAALTDPDHKLMVATIRDSGEGLLTILNDILDLAKIEAGKLAIERIAFDPATLSDRIARLHERPATARGLRLVIDCAVQGTRLGDPHRILQVMHNLVGNAVKFTSAGEVRMRIAAGPDDTIVLTVADTGIGMNEDALARAFEDFEQAEDSVSRRFGGTGLGLAIVRRLVELMDGTLAAESTPGRGTTVTVTLPAPAATAPSPQAAAAPADCGPLAVLMADDNATNRLILRAMLRNLGHSPTLAEDGPTCLARARSGTFDLVLLDISMPEMDGMATLAALRAEGHTAPAIAVTAHAMTHQIAEYYAAGFDGYVAKPFRSDALAAEIARVMERRAATPRRPACAQM